MSEISALKRDGNPQICCKMTKGRYDTFSGQKVYSVGSHTFTELSHVMYSNI